MNCPSCGREMKAGWFYAGNDPVFWSPVPDTSRAPASRFPEDVLIAKNSRYYDCPAAYLCKDCRKMVVDF